MILLSLAATIVLPLVFAQIPFSLPEIPNERGFVLPGKPLKEPADKASTNSEEERTSGRRLGELIHDVSKELYLTINNPYYYGRRTSTPWSVSHALPSTYPTQLSPFAGGVFPNQLPHFQPPPGYPLSHEAFFPMSQHPIEAYLAAQQSLRSPNEAFLAAQQPYQSPWNSPLQPNFGLFPYKL